MRGQERTTGTARSTLRKALEAIVGGRDDGTVIEECRRCGTTLESRPVACPACGASDVVEYRI
nr:hypothetical protein [Natrinema caseinilyticum]